MASPMAMAASRLLRLSSRCSSSSSFSRWFFRELSSFRASATSPVCRRPLLGPAGKVSTRRVDLVAFPASPAVAGAAYSTFEHYSGSSSATDAVDAVEGPAEAAAEAVTPHAWPEWAGFLEKLREKGYFEGASSEAEEGEEGGGAAESASSSMDFNRVKAACLNFARERFDLLRSLPREDIQTVVECGCPTTHRKPINSGKRLRAYLKLNEKDVCSACNLRGSCDRANLILNEEEGARTVDILRIILCYAADPTLLSRFEVSQRKRVEWSICSLLSELIKLTDTVIDPALTKTTMKHRTKGEQSQTSLGMEKNCRQNVEMKRGDWICSKCNFLNFARNLRCLECKAEGPKNVDPGDVEMKKGDWTCPRCRFMNFARNKSCKRCQGQRPPRQLNPGEWECPSCDFLNYRRNRACLKCNLERPVEEPNESAEHLWKKPDLRENEDYPARTEYHHVEKSTSTRRAGVR